MIDMAGELLYFQTEQQLRQLALTRAHNLLKNEVIWGNMAICAVVVISSTSNGFTRLAL